MFPHNTVLINFAIINRMDLLEKLANGNGQWCATVAGECAESAGYPGLAALSAAEDIFGEPLYPNPAEHQDVQVLRNQLASPGDPPTKHLGDRCRHTLGIRADPQRERPGNATRRAGSRRLRQMAANMML
jgi:hypothetical protein